MLPQSWGLGGLKSLPKLPNYGDKAGLAADEAGLVVNEAGLAESEADLVVKEADLPKGRS